MNDTPQTRQPSHRLYVVKGEDVRHKGEEAMSILLEDMDEG